MKGLYQRGSQFWIRFTPAAGAKQVRLPLGTTDEAVAIQEARKVMARESAMAREQAGTCAVEIEAAMASWKKAGLAASTLTTRLYVLRSFVASVGAGSPRLISRQAVQRWHDGVVEAKNAHTAADYLLTVRLWFKWLLEHGRLTSNPASEVKTPKLAPRRRRSFLMPDQARRLLDACTDLDLKFALYCGLHAGLRKNEIVEARPEWFDLEAGLLHVQTTATFVPKDRDNRTIPLTTEFRDWLRSDFGLRSPFMFRSQETHGAYRYRSDFRKSFESLLKKCELTGCTFHDLRRTFASLLASKGVSIYKIAAWLGDELETVQLHYGHLIPQDDQINASWT